MTADPGATPVGARSLAPDLARGGMLLLIALANVHLYVYGDPIGPRGYPGDLEGVDHAVALVQMMLVDGRAYPLFGLLFGYGIVQLAWRRSAIGLPVEAVTRVARRRGAWMMVIGMVHGVLLWSGDIVGAYGLLALLMAGLLVRGSDRALVATSVCGAVVITLLYTVAAVPLPDSPPALLMSMTVADPGLALVSRAVEWVTAGLAQAIGVFGAVAIGAWAARRRYLDEPQAHRRLLVRVAIVGILVAVLGGLPLALMAAELWTSPSVPALLLAGGLHGLSGYAGGVGYAALFGLLAIRIMRRGAAAGPVTRALRACGQRSLSCYLAQSVAFVALLPAWTLGLGEGARLWQAALVGFGVWLVVLGVAAASERAGYRGPAEILLRRLTYGPRRAHQPA
jgi:uncharacterized membrane protein YeiB